MRMSSRRGERGSDTARRRSGVHASGRPRIDAKDSSASAMPPGTVARQAVKPDVQRRGEGAAPHEIDAQPEHDRGDEQRRDLSRPVLPDDEPVRQQSRERQRRHAREGRGIGDDPRQARPASSSTGKSPASTGVSSAPISSSGAVNEGVPFR